MRSPEDDQSSSKPVEVQNSEVLVLGVFHFTPSTSDLVSAAPGTLSSDKKQVEIERVIQALAKFKPTKIMLEVTPDDTAWINERYQSFLDDELQLELDEIDQLGLRVAQLLQHKELYGIDNRIGMDISGAMDLAASNGQDEVLKRINEIIGQLEGGIGDRIASDELTVAEKLRLINDEEVPLPDLGLYMALTEIGTSEEPVGADIIADWHQRNLRIFANLLRRTEKGDRILVIFGAGHAPLLRQFVREHPDLQPVSALDYLPTE